MTTTQKASRIRSIRFQQTPAVMCKITALIITLGLLAGCTPKVPPPTGVSNSALDLSIGYLGDEWTVQTNEGESLTLVPSNGERQGVVEFLVGPEQEGINLIEALDVHRSHVESLPDGVYSGGQELTGPMGTAFYSRGRYSKDGTTTEEIRILGLHPRSPRLIEVIYRYPAGEDSATRVSELIELYAQVE